MTLFAIGLGHNADPEDVLPFVPYQPLTNGLEYTRSTPTPEGSKEEGPFIRFVWGLLDETQFQAMKTQSGIIAARTCLVTLYAQDENYFWVYWNGRAVRPALIRKGYHMRDVPLLIKSLSLVV